MNYIDLVIVILGIIFLSSQQNKSEILSKEATNGLKLIMAFVIILHHLSSKVSAGSFISYFSNWGTLASGMFFLMSGYGLMVSLRKSKGNYLDHFLIHRFSKILVPYIIVNIFFMIYHYFTKGELWTFSLYNLLFHGDYLVNFSWFILAIMFFYLLFYVSAKLTKSQYLMMLLILLGTIFYLFWCHKHEFGVYWYNTCMGFWGGIVLGSSIGEKIKENLGKHFLITAILLILLYAMIPAVSSVFNITYILERPYLMMLLASLVFAVFIIVCSQKLDFSSKTMQSFSKYSFAIYMVQGLPMYFLRSDFLYLNSDIVYVALVLLCSCLLGYIVTRLNDGINFIWRTWRSPKKEH